MAASKPISLSTNIETFLFSLNNNFWFVIITIQKSSSLLYPRRENFKIQTHNLIGFKPNYTLYSIDSTCGSITRNITENEFYTLYFYIPEI